MNDISRELKQNIFKRIQMVMFGFQTRDRIIGSSFLVYKQGHKISGTTIKWFRKGSKRLKKIRDLIQNHEMTKSCRTWTWISRKRIFILFIEVTFESKSLVKLFLVSNRKSTSFFELLLAIWDCSKGTNKFLNPNYLFHFEFEII